MRVVTISREFLTACLRADPEFMAKRGRPCVLIVRLRYRGRRQDFAVPFRSNISKATPRSQFFPLPTRVATRPGCRHGLHYLKMFPVTGSVLHEYRADATLEHIATLTVIESNEKRIVDECQRYLDAYEVDGRPAYAVDIDAILSLLRDF